MTAPSSAPVQGKNSPKNGIKKGIRKKGARQEKRCLLTGQFMQRDTMLRFVLAPDGELICDLAEKLPGRGFWLANSADTVATAVGDGNFLRQIRRKLPQGGNVHIRDGLPARIDAGLVMRALNTVSMARRGAAIIAGFDKITAWREKHNGTGGALLTASDGAEGAKKKARQLFNALVPITLFTAAELGPPVGLEHAVHIHIKAGGFARATIHACHRLACYRGIGNTGSADGLDCTKSALNCTMSHKSADKTDNKTDNKADKQGNE